VLTASAAASASAASVHLTAHRTQDFVRNWEDIGAPLTAWISQILSPVTHHNPRVGGSSPSSGILESPQTPGLHGRRAIPPTAQGNELNNAVQGPGCLFARARARPGACGSRLPVVRPGSVGGHRSVSPSGRAPGIRGRTHREPSTLADDRSPSRHGGSFPYPTWRSCYESRAARGA
jgi:hypothetical protein